MPKNVYQSLPGCESPKNHFTIHLMYVPSILTTKQAPGVSPMSPTLQDASQRSDLRLRLPRLLSHGRGGLVAVADREWCGRALVICGDEDEDPWGWLGGIFFIFIPDPWGNDPIWRAYFSYWLKPPTRWSLWFFVAWVIFFPSLKLYNCLFAHPWKRMKMEEDPFLLGFRPIFWGEMLKLQGGYIPKKWDPNFKRNLWGAANVLHHFEGFPEK